ncbi:MAG: AAA family ATPase [Filimonas sp.]|nr:AAA family ATPase [Filimonas sp.]
MEKEHCYVITGGPGAGKTTLLHALKEKYNYVDEVARTIIQEEMARNGTALPWADKVLYRDIMLERSIATFSKATNNCVTFFDRGIPDVVAYTLLIGTQVTPQLHEAASQNRYNKQVFILPPWKEIYCTDTERKQDFDEAIKTYEVLCDVYEQYGYHLIQVPFLPVKQRAAFIELSIL